MLFEIKNKIFLLKFRVLLLVLISLLWIGCSTEQMQNVTGSMPVNAYSVVQGLITSGSIISRSTEASLSRIVFEDGTLVNLNPSDTFSSSEEYSYSQQENNNIIFNHDSEDSLNQQLTNSNIDLDRQGPSSDGLYLGPPLNISLVTDLGIVLQTGTFDRYTETGKLHYRFAGDFPTESIRLRIVQEDKIFEVAMGSLEETEEVVDVPELDLVNSALATRMMEQTREYKNLRNKGIFSFVESMNSVIQRKIIENPSKSLLIENINRVGINSEGKFEIYPTSYDPFKHRNPDQAKDWEIGLFHPNTDIPLQIDSSDLEVEEDSDKKLTVKKELVNWVKKVTLKQTVMNEEIELFKDLDFSPQKILPVNGKTFTLRIYFKESLPVEFRNSVLSEGILKIQNGDSQHNLPLIKINSRFQDSQVLELGIEISDLFTETNNRIAFIFLQHTFPDFQTNQIAQAFFKVGVESN